MSVAKNTDVYEGSTNIRAVDGMTCKAHQFTGCLNECNIRSEEMWSQGIKTPRSQEGWSD